MKNSGPQDLHHGKCGDEMSFLDFYSKKKVLITGHTGFKGSWLTIWLKLLGSEVTGLSLEPNTEPSLFRIAGIQSKMNSYIVDIRDYQSVNSIFNRVRPEIVFHLAAQPLVRHSYKNPLETYTTNIIGTANILEAIRHTNCVRAVVVVTSDKCYHNQEHIWGYRESDSMGGRDPYSSSKGCAELITASYRESFLKSNNVGVATARAGNVIGGGDWAENRLLPDIVKAITANKPVVLRNPGAIRPWQHVLEPLRGYLMLGHFLWNNEFAEAWNFGPDINETINVQSLAEKVIEIWGKGSIKIEPDNSMQPEANYLKLDCTKARTLLGWKPLYGIQDTVSITVNQYKKLLNSPHAAFDIIKGEIFAYMEHSCNEQK